MHASDPPQRPFDPELELAGAVFMVPNRHWGFGSLTSDDHPGACVQHRSGAREGTLVKGTDADNVRNSRKYYCVSPTAENGLRKHTGFELLPRYFRWHRLRLYYPERYLGRLDSSVLHGLCTELGRLNPEE
jgi:hypothetical protein